MADSNKTNPAPIHPDPTALGLFGLAMVTLVASTQKLGITDGTALVIPWAVFLGALAQLYAGKLDYQKGNLFGGTAFCAYGFFWLAVSVTWMINAGTFGDGLKNAADIRQLGFAFVGYLVFSLYMTIAAVETNKVLLTIFILIDLLFLGLGLSTLGVLEQPMHTLAAIAELGIAVASFYGSAANILNHHLKREFLPVGKPCGKLKKHKQP